MGITPDAVLVHVGATARGHMEPMALGRSWHRSPRRSDPCHWPFTKFGIRVGFDLSLQALLR